MKFCTPAIKSLHFVVMHVRLSWAVLSLSSTLVFLQEHGVLVQHAAVIFNICIPGRTLGDRERILSANQCVLKSSIDLN